MQCTFISSNELFARFLSATTVTGGNDPSFGCGFWKEANNQLKGVWLIVHGNNNNIVHSTALPIWFTAGKECYILSVRLLKGSFSLR